MQLWSGLGWLVANVGSYLQVHHLIMLTNFVLTLLNCIIVFSFKLVQQFSLGKHWEQLHLAPHTTKKITALNSSALNTKQAPSLFKVSNIS